MPVLLAGLRRFASVLALAACFGALVGIFVAAVWRMPLGRGVAVGLYVVGCILLIAGFFTGNRGPVRASREGGIPVIGSRFLRWATRDELDEQLNASAVYVSLGFALILLGIVAESA